jgi:hypothetical protein
VERQICANAVIVSDGLYMKAAIDIALPDDHGREKTAFGLSVC